MLRDQQASFLEACLSISENIGDGFVARAREQRNERRMEGDTDWTGVVSERFIKPPTKGALLRQGLKVVSCDEDFEGRRRR